MPREIGIHQIVQGVLRAELRHIIAYFHELGHVDCELVFGWPWGMDYPPGKPWATMRVALAEVEAEVRKPADAGLGDFGSDDVTIRIPSEDVEFCFCHHQGIHLTFSREGTIAKDFLERWASAGFSPAESDAGG